MGAGISHKNSQNYAISKVAKKNIDESYKMFEHRGSYGYPFVSKDFFYKIVEFKDPVEAAVYNYHAMATRKILASDRLCHAIESRITDTMFVITKYPRLPYDLYFAKNKLEFHILHKIVIHLIETVAEIHANGVNHCDLKPENVLVNNNHKSALCDLDGMCRVRGIQKVGSEFYAPPVGLLRDAISMAQRKEISWFEVYSFVDLYGLGKIIEHVFYQHFPGKPYENFWKAMSVLLTRTNVNCFFASNTRKIRAADCFMLMRKYNVKGECEVCDCIHRFKEWNKGCFFCYAEENKSDEIREASDSAMQFRIEIGN